MRHALVGLAVVFVIACSKDVTQSAQLPNEQAPAAEINGKTITVAELDQAWLKTDPAQHAQANQAIYDGRRAALDTLVADMLVEQAAKAKNETPAKYVEDELKRRVKEPTDEEVARFYEQNRAQMQGRSLEEVSSLIRPYITNQRTTDARVALIDELRKAGPPVRVLLDAPRQQIVIDSEDPSEGPASAPVTLIEFSDFQCPFCQRVMPTIKELRQKYGDQLRVVWKDFPLTQIHPQAFSAAMAGNCAREQGRFWELHDLIFPNQQEMQSEFLKRYASQAGMDAAKFSACFDSSKYKQKVQDAIQAGARLGISSTPTIYINGRMVQGAQPIGVFTSIIDDELSRHQ